MINEPDGFSRLSDAVFVADEAVATISSNDIDFLKHQATVLPVRKYSSTIAWKAGTVAT